MSTDTHDNSLNAINPAEQAIYALFMADPDGKTNVVREETSTDTFPQSEDEARAYIQSNLENLSSDTLDAYLGVNSLSTKLPPDMDLGVSYVLISTPDFREITANSNWRDIWKQKYPGSEESCLVFSRIGFNASQTQALLYVTRLWVDGGYHLLEFDSQNGIWEIVEDFINVNIN